MIRFAPAGLSRRPIQAGVAETPASWRLAGLGVLRIAFGLVWAIDASFKWQPDFAGGFTEYLTSALKGQPSLVQAWISFWVNLVKVDPAGFAHVVALGETLIALGLIFGVLTNLTAVGGTLLALVIWSTAEGFGGPYQPGSTDIGAAIIYALVFVALALTRAGLYLGFDRRLTVALGRWGFLASGSPPLTETQSSDGSTERAA